jgi:hypothetical protein
MTAAAADRTIEDMSEALCMEAVVDEQAKAAEGPAGGAMVARARALPVRVGPVLAFMFTAGGLAMVPWLFVLAAWLPATTVVPHYRIAWIGLDTVEGAGLFASHANRDRPKNRPAAGRAGTPGQ